MTTTPSQLVNKLKKYEKLLDNNLLNKISNDYNNLVMEYTLKKGEMEKESYKAWSDELFHLNLLILSYKNFFELFNSLTKRNKKHELIWPNKNTTYNKGSSGDRLLAGLFCTLTNNILSIRNLSMQGLDFQAKTLLRSFVECIDLTICVMGDFKFFMNYSNSDKQIEEKGDFFDSQREIWYKNFRPKKINTLANRILDGINEKNLNKIYRYLRDCNYEWLSLYAHNNNGAITIGNIEMNNISKNRVEYSIYGTLDAKTTVTFRETIMIGIIGIDIFKALIELNHKKLIATVKYKLFEKQYLFLTDDYYEYVVTIFKEGIERDRNENKKED